MPPSSAPRSAPRYATVAALLQGLGDVPAGRVRLWPLPGTATERDLLDVLDHQPAICELVDGTLVEKAMGLPESALTMRLITWLGMIVYPNCLGELTGPDGTMCLAPGLVRIPDIAFFAADRLPGRRLPKTPVPDLVPDLAVAVLSPGNTPAEMTRKRREYFAAGVRSVWIVDSRARTVTVYSGPRRKRVLAVDQTLEGGDVLPGFALPLRELFG